MSRRVGPEAAFSEKAGDRPNPSGYGGAGPIGFGISREIIFSATESTLDMGALRGGADRIRAGFKGGMRKKSPRIRDFMGLSDKTSADATSCGCSESPFDICGCAMRWALPRPAFKGWKRPASGMWRQTFLLIPIKSHVIPCPSAERADKGATRPQATKSGFIQAPAF